MTKYFISVLFISFALLGCTEKQQADATKAVDAALEKNRTNEEEALEKQFAKEKAAADEMLSRPAASSNFQYKGPTAAEIAEKNRKANQAKEQNK